MSRLISDLSTFIEAIGETGQLVHVQKMVNRHHEAGEVIAACEKNGNVAVLFHQVEGSRIPLCGNLLGSVDRVALALGVEKPRIQEVLDAALKCPLAPETVAEGSCQEVILRENIDLEELPIPTHAPEDAGAYITSGLVFAKSVNGGRQNISYHRMEVKGKDRLGIFINEWRHLANLYNGAESLGQGLPIAVVIGCDPVHYITAGLRTDADELGVSGALRKSPVPVVRCITSDILVPATSEIVIEGIILPRERELEGPLGEFTGHYSKTWENPLVKVTAITHRKNPVYQTINSASREHVLLGNVIPREPVLADFVGYVSSGILDVHIPPCGSGFLAVVQVNKSNPGEPKNIAMAAMVSNVNIKNVIVVDGDVDIYDMQDVLWAVSNRASPLRDFFTVPYSQCHELDPTCDVRGVGTKLGIDATLKEESKKARRVVYPVRDLKDYLQQ